MSLKLFISLIIFSVFTNSAFAGSPSELSREDLIQLCLDETTQRDKEGLEKFDAEVLKLVLLGWNPGYFVVNFNYSADEAKFIEVLGAQGRDIFAMTHEALNIWKELLECFDGDTHSARAAFAFNLTGVNCLGKTESRSLQQKINLFKANFHNALLSNEQRQISLGDYHDNRLQHGYFFNDYAGDEGSLSLRSINFKVYRESYKRLKTIQIHPLISQLALQIMVKFYHEAGPNDFFKLNSKFRFPNQQYLNLFNNSLRILLEVNNSPGAIMGLWINAGWATWIAMSERLVLFAHKLYEFKGNTATLVSGAAHKGNFKMFYGRFLTNFRVVTSSMQQANLPHIYFSESEKLLEQYFDMEDPYQNIKISK